MNVFTRTFAAVAACTVAATGAFAQSSVVIVDKEAAPRLFVQQPLAGPLAKGVVFIPYRVENLRILPLGGAAASNVSPRVGHLHVTVNDLPWQWADYGESNTIILVGMPRGRHKVLIELVDPEGNVFTGQTVTFNSPGKAPRPEPGTKRTDLQRHDLSAPGREVVQVRVDFDPGYVAPKHTHYGEEIIYVIEGTLEYYVEGRPAKTYTAGDVLIVPAETIHWVKNVGTDNGAELATYIVEKGKPLITWVKQP